MPEIKQYTLDELRVKLTEKERVFCHQYIIDWNGARSARYAGYSEDSARQIACDTLTKAYIQQYISFIKNNLEEESGISKLRNLQELAKIAYSNIAHLHNTWIELKEFELLTDDQKATIESIDTKTEQRSFIVNGEPENIDVKYIKIKLFPKIPAIDQINKMMGYNLPIKTEISGELSVTRTIIKWGDKEIEI
jgi:phage terminase small subunit